MTTFYCSIDKVQTMADGSFRVYLGLPETAIVQASEMMAYHVHGTVLDVAMTPRQNDDGEQSERRKIHI